MLGISKSAQSGVLLIAIFSIGVEAQTINAVSCNTNDVQKALNSVSADGTTVVIPAGNCTWSSSVVYKQVYSTTIQGQTSCAGTPASSCIDNTVINWTGSGQALSVATASEKSFRITGMSFNFAGMSAYGALFFGGNSTAFRFDHSDIYGVPSGYVPVATDGPTGVMDHLLISGADNTFFWFSHHSSWKGVGIQGDNSWAQPAAWGGPDFMFFEDSTITATGQNGATGATHGMAAEDCAGGGRTVIRHNILNGSSFQDHTTGHAGDDRGCRAMEAYLNTFPAISGVTGMGPGLMEFNVAFVDSGAHLTWGNTVAANTYSNFISLHNQRCGPNGGSCGKTYNQTVPPAGWGYCGTIYGPSAWDQNQTTTNSSGGACLDQVGRGQGDLLQGTFPSKCNLTLNPSCNVFTGQWPRQAVTPMYVWNNTYSGGTYLDVYEFYVNNADYFTDQGANCPQNAATCSTGIGEGTLAQRPANCVANSFAYPAGNSPGVGWWATDTNTLYVCTATNTWTAYYTPYTYPHPLQGTAQGTAPVAPPTNLLISVR